MAKSNSPIFNPPQTGPLGDIAIIDRVPLDHNEFGFRKSQQGLAEAGAKYKFPIATIPTNKA